MDNIGTLLFIFAVALVFVSILAATIGYFFASSATKSALLDQAQSQLQTWKNQELSSIRQQMLEGVRGEAIKEAQEQLVKWRNEDLESVKRQIWAVVNKEATVNLEQWKVDVETEIRRDAIDRSQSVTMGKMTEHIVPYLPGFGFDPRDARFLGSPIDLVVFDGLGNGDIKKIVFIEIKTGLSTLSTRERYVRDAVIAGRIEWMEVKANLDGADVVHPVKSRKSLSA